MIDYKSEWLAAIGVLFVGGFIGAIAFASGSIQNPGGYLWGIGIMYLSSLIFFLILINTGINLLGEIRDSIIDLNKLQEWQGDITNEEKYENKAKELKQRGDYAFNNNDYQKAIDYYDEALELSPENQEIYHSLSIVYMATGNFQKSKEYLNLSKKSQ